MKFRVVEHKQKEANRVERGFKQRFDGPESSFDGRRALMPQSRLRLLIGTMVIALIFAACDDAGAGRSLGDYWHMISTPEGFRELIQLGGYLILWIIIFSETGLLIGFFLPGDSLLVTAGVLAAAGMLDIVLLNVLLIPAAIIGDATGYSIGFRTGHRLYDRPDSRFFKKEHIEKTHAFYEKHGGKTIIIARFVPIIRTFAPVVAGVARMRYRDFAMFNIVGGIGWIASTTLLGYFLGSSIPEIESYLHYVIGVIILLSIIPIIVEFIKHRRRKALAAEEK
jgi:membrane-associated protein